MKVLTISTCFPYPPDDGTKIQIYERVRSLAERHDISLLCVVSESISPDRIKELERYCKCICIQAAHPREPATAIGKAYQILRSVVLQEPYYIHDSISKQAQLWLTRELASETFDVVDADGYASSYLCSCHTAVRVAIFHSVSNTCADREILLTQSFVRKFVAKVYKTLTQSHDAKVIEAADLCVTLTEDNRRDLQSLYPQARVRNCLSNGVDMDYFAYRSPIEPPSGICFVGKMDYTPNIDAVLWFVAEILPRIREKLPDFRFVVIGSHPTDPVKALSADKGITVTGYVDDVRPHMRECGLIALPMRMGGGILNKLLQALALGIPVVATSLSLEGLSVLAARDLLVGDSPEDLSKYIVQLAQDEALRVRLAKAGRQYVESAHQWKSMAKRYEAELESCLALSNTK